MKCFQVVGMLGALLCQFQCSDVVLKLRTQERARNHPALTGAVKDSCQQASDVFGWQNWNIKMN